VSKIPEHILNEIQDRCDIVEIISSYIPLKPAGRNFKAACPFHHEKTPSFVVSPDKQIYHCFGCNSGGNVFNFIREYEKIDFIDAVKMLAEKTGIKLPSYKKQNNEDDSIVSAIYSVNNIAADFYRGLLEKSASSSDLRRYMEKRGLDLATVKNFSLGCADASWKSLADYLSKRGISPDIGSKAGLVLRGKEGSYYDLFRNRMIFPIWDAGGKVIGFGARVLDDSLPKYINSPETAVYKKSQHLYGLNFAKNSIREKGFAIITEGYLDVITSHQYGITNTIASLGTALTVEQIRLLRRYTHNVVMLYDADQAGETASIRGLDLFLEEGMNVKIAALEKGHDPDSYIRKFGPRGFDAAVKKAKNLFQYKLDILKERFGGTEPEVKAEIVKEMLSTISKIRNNIIKAEYIKNLSHELSVKEELLWEELKEDKKGAKVSREAVNRIQAVKREIIISPAEKILIKLMLEDVNVIDIVKENLRPLDFKTPSARYLVETIFDIYDENKILDIKKIITCMEDRVSPGMISFIVTEDIEIKDRARNIADCIRNIKKEKKDEALKNIQNRLAAAHEKGSEGEAQALLEEFNTLIKSEG
jgi:DNA primase